MFFVIQKLSSFIKSHFLIVDQSACTNGVCSESFHANEFKDIVHNLFQ